MKFPRKSPAVTSVLAVLATIWILGIFTAVLFVTPKCGDGTTNLIIQAVYGLIMLVFGFYFGTSYGSRLKDEAIIKMPPPPATTCCKGTEPGVNPKLAIKKPGGTDGHNH